MGSSKGGGSSVWLMAPPNVSPESRLVADLPEMEFTYIERPWLHFLTRWAAIDTEIQRMLGNEAPFTLVDLGSCCGFFSLQASAGYPRSLVVGIEGSVGVGNGTTGVEGTKDEIIQTKAVQTHLRWIEKMTLHNCFVSPEVWDYRKVCALAALGQPICDVMLTLSVVHHIDSVSTQQYTALRMEHVEGTVSLMAKLLELAPRHFIELPDRPWIEHVHNHFGTARAFLEAATQKTGRQWSWVGPLVISEWYGQRELWLLEDVGASRVPVQGAGIKALFPRALGLSAAPLAELGRMPLGSLPRQHQSIQPGNEQLVIDPGLRELGAALLAAPTALIASHVQLREAMLAAEGLLKESRTLS